MYIAISQHNREGEAERINSERQVSACKASDSRFDYREINSYCVTICHIRRYLMALFSHYYVCDRTISLYAARHSYHKH